MAKEIIVEKYSYLKGIEKTLLRVFVIAGPIMFTLLPEDWMNLTLGAVITFAINYAKNYNLNEEVKS